jgi:hypothetical protein
MTDEQQTKKKGITTKDIQDVRNGTSANLTTVELGKPDREMTYLEKSADPKMTYVQNKEEQPKKDKKPQ